jgi:hypothetical protein
MDTLVMERLDHGEEYGHAKRTSSAKLIALTLPLAGYVESILLSCCLAVKEPKLMDNKKDYKLSSPY